VKRTHKIIAARAALLATLMLAGCVSITPIDLTGTWSGTLTWTSGPATGLSYPRTLQLIDGEGEITGAVTLMGPGSQPFHLTISDADALGHSISLSASGTMTMITPPIQVSILLNGNYDEMSMSGTGSQTADGQTYEFDWQLTRITPIPES